MYSGARATWAISINDFSGGLVTSPSPYAYASNQTPRCMNVYSSTKTRNLRKRSGRIKLNQTSVGSSMEGHAIGDLGLVNGTRKQLAHFGNKIYKMDAFDETWDELTSARGDVTGHMTSHFVGGTNYAIFCDDAQTMPYKWNGIDLVATAVDSTVPLGAVPISWRNRLFLCDIKDNPMSFWYSDEDSFTFQVASKFTFPNPRGEKFRAWGELRGSLFCFTERRIAKITFLGGSPLLEVRWTKANIGTISPETVKLITYQGEEVLVFLGSDRRVYVFDGYKTIPISVAIEEDNFLSEISMASLNELSMQSSHAIVDEALQWYVLFVGNLGQTPTINHALVFDYSGAGAWWVFDNQGLGSSGESFTSTGKRRILVTDYAGFAYYWNEGITDSGTTIETEWTTHKLSAISSGNLTTRHSTKGKFYRPYFKEIGSSSVSFAKKIDLADDWVADGTMTLKESTTAALGSFVLGTDELADKQVITKGFDLPNTFDHVELRLTDSITIEPWTMQKIDLTGFVVGIGPGTGETQAP